MIEHKTVRRCADGFYFKKIAPKNSERLEIVSYAGHIKVFPEVWSPEAKDAARV